jgi:hypothetical protein
MPLTLLLCSNDMTLSLTRELLLTKAGYRVITSLNATDAVDLLTRHHFEGVVLCQTLSTEECEAIMAAASRLSEPVKTVLVTDQLLGLPSITKPTAVIPPFQSPRSLLRVVKETFVQPSDYSVRDSSAKD